MRGASSSGSSLPGVRSTGRPRSPLSREAIIEVALAQIDAGGIESLTMRQLGTALGVDPMMVYRYFPDKAAVLDGVMGQLWALIDLESIEADQPWTALLADVMIDLRAALLAHPRAISIVGTRPATGPGLLVLLDRILGLLQSAGMPIEETTADLLNALVNYTVGHVLAEVGDAVGGGAEHDNTALSPAELPHLAAVFGSGWQYDATRQFERAVRAMIAGSEASS